EFVRMPARGEGSSLCLAVTDHAGDNQVWVIVGCAIRVRNRISELAALMYRAWSLWGHMAWNTAREGELGEQALHTFFVLGDVWVDFAIGSFEVGVGDQGGPPMSRAGDVEHIKVVLLD